MRVDAVNSNRQFQRFADFRGVDYSSSPLEVQSNRATDMANLILRDGTLHKRNGFEQLHYLQGQGTEQIKGAWVMNRFEAVTTENGTEDHEVEVLIYVQGQSVMEYNITYGGNPKTLYTSENKKITEKVSGFVSVNDLYILCGEYLKVERTSSSFVVKRLNCDFGFENKDNVYIPLTTKNIVRENSKLEYQERVLAEPINALTNWRKNQLKWETKDSTQRNSLGFITYYFDGNVKNTNDSDFYPKLFINGKEIGEWHRLTDEFEYALNAPNSSLHGTRIAWTTIEDKARILFPYDASLNNNDEIIVVFNTGITGEEITSVGTVGAIFGNDGRSDRLFFATGQYVRYTENTLKFTPNFTYVPVTNIVRCGSTGKITSMLRLSNGSLAVFKDVENRQEPTVYYISGRYVEAGTDDATDDADVTLYDDLFTVKSGNIEESCPTPYGIDTLAGDSLFVSKSGVYGIELSGNVATDDRFARMRSRIINSKLTKFDLTKAKAIVHDNRYYLAVGGKQNEVYVADARYKYTAEGDMSNTFNYEWFRWTDIPVALWLVKGGELWFISTDNYLCRFTDKYYDKYLTSQGEEVVKGGKVFFNIDLLPIVQKALYAEYKVEKEKNGEKVETVERYDIVNLYDYDETENKESPKWAFDIPLEDGQIELSFVVPVKAYWKSAVTSLGSSIHRKNMYSLSVVVQPAKQSEVSVGYTTRLRERLAMDAEGTNQFDFGDVSFESYGEGDAFYQMFSFDAGGFISAYRQRVFERNFVYAQLMFACNSIGDCIVEEMTVEYAVTRKNIGVG